MSKKKILKDTFKKLTKLNENTTENLWDAAKAALKGKCIALKMCILEIRKT